MGTENTYPVSLEHVDGTVKVGALDVRQTSVLTSHAQAARLTFHTM